MMGQSHEEPEDCSDGCESVYSAKDFSSAKYFPESSCKPAKPSRYKPVSRLLDELHGKVFNIDEEQGADKSMDLLEELDQIEAILDDLE